MRIFCLWLSSLLSLVMPSSSLPNPQPRAQAATVDNFDLHANAAILIEAQSGRVLYEKQADEVHFPASMTKMMGMYLILDSIAKETLSFDDVVTCSAYAASMGGTQIFLEEGEQMTVRDLFKAVAINSANDAITALGEHLAGTNEAFVQKMNDTARDLAMNNTHFANPTGFDDDTHVTTPRDMAIIAQQLVGFGETLFQFTRLKEAYVREDSNDPFWLVNTNKMLGHYEGMDGLKTGYTSKAGYNLTATAMRGGIRLISVVMNEKTIAERSQDTTTLLNYGFSTLSLLKLFPMQQEIARYHFRRSANQDVPLITACEVNIVVDKGTKVENLQAIIRLERVEAPIQAGERVGWLIISDDQGHEFYYPITVMEDVTLINYWDYFKKLLLEYFA